MHHSNRGSNYTSIRFAQRLDDHGILASRGSVGDSYDNALMKSFFSTLKTVLVYRRSWRTREQAENALFADIDGWYDTERIQARLGWRSPDGYETAWRTSQPAPEDRPAADIAGPDPGTRRVAVTPSYRRNLTTGLFIDGWNERCHPFVWTKTADELLNHCRPVKEHRLRDASRQREYCAAYR